MNVVGYARLSRDEDKQNYGSIENQLKIIQDYADKNNLIISKNYIDDNYSGYTFDRPSFKEMINELNNIDVIIAKDLSRIGRHNAKVLLFIEQVKEQNKTLILTDEGSKGYNTNDDNDDVLGISTWFNERYIKDISRKIRSSFKIKQKEGRLVFHEFYGYTKSPQDKHTLLIDEEIAEYVKLIFKLYIDGNGYKKVCDILNERNIPTPSTVLKRHLDSKNKIFKNKTSLLWQTHMIKRIISNNVYIGVLTCGKTTKPTIKGKTIKNSEEKQYIFNNHHEPIISKEEFNLAQEINIKRNIGNLKGTKKNTYMFSGFLKCQDCGKPMVARVSPNGSKYYECGNYSKYGKSRCFAHAIKESVLLMMFKKHLVKTKNALEEYIKNIRVNKAKKDVSSLIKKLEQDYEILNEEFKAFINQKIRDIMKQGNEYRSIIEQTYNDMENEKKIRIKEIQDKLSSLKESQNIDLEKVVQTALDVLNNIISQKEITRTTLEILLNKIIIDKDRIPQIESRTDFDNIFTNPIDTMKYLSLM